jgi:hypothetical protein
MSISDGFVAPAPSDSTPSNPPAPRRRSPLGRAFDFVFPPAPDARRVPSGILGDNRFETLGYVLALALAAGAAVFLEFIMTQSAVPPGGDPGQWITTSYAYVGLPYPSWIIPGQYPPLSFPLLGAIVRASGVVLGARIYIAAVTLLLGLAGYFWARAVVRTWTIALLIEGFLLLNPSFIELFFFGAYPNLLGFVFFFLAIGFAVRFVRSRSGNHAFWFWICLGAAVLTHTLVAVMLVATIAFIALPLLALRRIPRELFTDRRSQLGALIGLGAVAAFYGLTSLLGVPHNQYLSSGAFAYVKNGLGAILSLLLVPAFPAFTIAASTALELFVLFDALLLIVLAVFVVFRPWVFTLSLLVVIASLLGVTTLIVVGWELAIVTDYVRLGYFLIPGSVLLLGIIADWATSELRKRYAARRSRPAPPAPGRPRRWSPAWPLPSSVLVLVLGVVLLVVMTSSLTAAQANLYESNGTTVAHSQEFLGAIDLIRSTHTSGAVLTVPGAVKWTRALLDTNTYGPFIPGHYSFDPNHILDQELAYFALTDRYAVTNQLVAFTVTGANSTFANQSPMYQASYFGLYSPIFQMSPANITVTVQEGTAKITESVTAPPLVVLPTNSLPTVSEVFTQRDFQLVLTETALPGATFGRLTIQASATGGHLLAGLRVVLSNPPVGSGSVSLGKSPGEFTWSPNAFGGALRTYGNVTPTGALVGVNNNYGKNRSIGPLVTFHMNGSGGKPAAALSFSYLVDTPGAQNLINDLPAVISTTALWSQWDARFVLYGNNSVPSQLQRGVLPSIPPYLEEEFGARIVGYSGIWVVLMLPEP